MLDPGMIGTLIIGLNAEARTELEIEKGGPEQDEALRRPTGTRSRGMTRDLAKGVARSLRSVADKFEPTVDSGPA